MSISYPSASARHEAEEKVCRCAKALIENQDYLSLQRLFSRLSSEPSFDIHVFDIMQRGAVAADDSSLTHAVMFTRRLAQYDSGQ